MIHRCRMLERMTEAPPQGLLSCSFFTERTLVNVRKDWYLLIPPSSFHRKTTRRCMGLHSYVVHIPFVCTKRLALSFVLRTANHSLPASIFWIPITTEYSTIQNQKTESVLTARTLVVNECNLCLIRRFY